MAQINFPTATSNGQTFEADNGVIYTYVGTPPNGFWSGSFQATGLTTLDARFLKLDSSNDPVTGGLNITGGSVGIGTSSPAQLLDIASLAPNLRLTDTVDGHSEIDGNSANLKFNADKGDEKADSNISFAIDNSEKVRITSGGYVGIGTSSPSMLLDVAGASSPQIKVSATNTGSNSAGLYIENQGQRNWQIWADRSSDQLRIGHASRTNTAVSITTSRVGIGTTTPNAKFEVVNSSTSLVEVARFRTEGNTNNPLLKINADEANAKMRISSLGSNSSDLTLGAGDVDHLMIKHTSGFVGVGVTSPLGKLQVRAADECNFVVREESTVLVLSAETNNGRDSNRPMKLESSQLRFVISGTEMMRVGSTGNVGIGTQSPDAKLHVASGEVSIVPHETGNELFLEHTDDCGMTIACGPDKKGSILFGEQGVGVSRGAIIYNTDGDSLAFSTAGRTNERMRITSTGRLGVNITSPASILHVGGSLNSDNFITFGKRVSSNESNLPVIGQTSTNGVNCDLGICSTSGGGSIRFYTGNGSGGFGDSLNDERLRIDSSGNAVFGDATISTNPVVNDEKGVAIRTAGNLITNTLTSNAPHQFRRNTTGHLVRFHMNSSGAVGSISVTSTATAYNTSSDYRLKENIVSIDDACERVLALKPRRFNFISNPEETVDGFIAHEAKEIVPECVEGEKDAVDEEGNPVYQGIDQAKLVPLLTAGLQEALVKIETLEQRLTDAGIE